VWTQRHPHSQFPILPLPSMEAARRAGEAPAPPSPAHIQPPSDRPAPPPSILRFLPHFLTVSPSKPAARLGPPPAASAHAGVLVPRPTSSDKVSTRRTRRHRARRVRAPGGHLRRLARKRPWSRPPPPAATDTRLSLCRSHSSALPPLGWAPPTSSVAVPSPSRVRLVRTADYGTPARGAVAEPGTNLSRGQLLQ
jgi:hypothetical protein